MSNDYSGNAAFVQSLADGLTPDPLMTVAEWADSHRMLSGRAAAEAGKYRTSRTPYMREIMENLSPSSPVERVVFMKAAQTGATEAGNNLIGFVIQHTLFIVQTYTGLQLPWATPDTVATIIGLVTPVLVWAIPNKKAADR